MKTTRLTRMLAVAVTAFVLCTLFAITSLAEITGGVSGNINGLESSKNYEVSSLTLNAAGTGLAEGEWTAYDVTASYAGIYKVREQGTTDVLATIYVYGPKADREDLFNSAHDTADKTTFVSGKWTSPTGTWKQGAGNIRPAAVWLTNSYADTLKNAMQSGVANDITAAKNAVLQGLQTKSFKYGYENTDVVAFDEINSLILASKNYYYAYTYMANATTTVSVHQTSGDGSESALDIVFYVTDLQGNITKHKVTTSVAKMNSSRTIDFASATFTPAVPTDKKYYVVGIEVFPYSGWTDPSKLNMWVSDTGTYSSSGTAGGSVYWTGDYYSIDDNPLPSLPAAPTGITGNYSNSFDGLDSNKNYLVATLTIASSGDALKTGEWKEYDPTATYAGLYSVREADASGNPTTEATKPIYVYGPKTDRQNLFSDTNNTSSTTNFTVGQWTSPTGTWKQGAAYLRPASEWLGVSYADALKAAMASGVSKDITDAKNTILQELQTKSFKYGYENTDIVAFSDINSLTIVTDAYLYAYTYKANATTTVSVHQTSGAASESAINVVFYVTDLQGNVTKHSVTTSVASMSSNRTIDFATATFTPAVPADRYVIGIEIFPYAQWTDPAKLGMYVSDTGTYSSSGKISSAIKWSGDYYSIDDNPLPPLPAAPTGITGTFAGSFNGLNSSKNYQVASLTLAPSGEELQVGTWKEYDPTASYAGLYSIREADASGNPASEATKPIYVYGKKADRENLFNDSYDSSGTTNFVIGKWSSPTGTWKQGAAYLRPASEWLGVSYADALKAAMESGVDKDITDAKNAILQALQTKSYKYGYDSTEIISFNEISKLSFISDTYLYAYTYKASATTSVGVHATSGAASESSANVVVYVADLEGNVTKHTVTTSVAAMNSTRIIDFETATFVPAVPANTYVVGVEVFPYAGWTDPAKLGMYVSDTGTYSSSGKASPSIKWTEGSYYTIKLPPLPKQEKPQNITLDGNTIKGFATDVTYKWASQYINSIGQETEFTGVESISTNGMVGLVRIVVAGDMETTIDSDPVYVYVRGDEAKRKELGNIENKGDYEAFRSQSIEDWIAGTWTGTEPRTNAIFPMYGIGGTSGAIITANDQTTARDAVASGAANANDLLTAMADKLNNIVFMYAYDETEIIPADELISINYTVSLRQGILRLGDSKAPIIDTKAVFHVLHADGSITKHEWTGDMYTTSATVTADVLSLNLTDGWIVGVEIYPYANVTASDITFVDGSENFNVTLVVNVDEYAIKIQPPMPELVALGAADGGLGEIAGLNPLYVYEYRVAGSTDAFTKIDIGTTSIALPAGLYEFRVAASDVTLVSECQEVLVESLGARVSLPNETKKIYLASDFEDLDADYEIDVTSKTWIATLALSNIKTVAPNSTVTVMGDGYRFEFKGADILVDNKVHYYNFLISFNGESRSDEAYKYAVALAGDTFVKEVFIESTNVLPFENGKFFIQFEAEYDGAALELHQYNDDYRRYRYLSDIIVENGWAQLEDYTKTYVITVPKI